MRLFEDYIVGTVERFGAYRVTRDEVIEFASRFDPQPFHLDDKAAEANPIFGSLAASGWHTCAMTMRILTDGWTEDGYFSLGGTGVDSLRWTRPVHPDDTLSVEAEILSKSEPKSKPEIGFVTMRIHTFNQQGETVMEWTVTNIQKKRFPST